MSECVVRMEMPENCCECQIRQEDYEMGEEFCPFTGVECLSIGRQNNCPIICSLPVGHGTLIDLETAAEGLSERFNSCHMTCGAVMQFLDGLPTIVPTERSET